MMQTKRCRFCHEKFQTSRKDKFYCSKECRWNARRTLHGRYTREIHRLKAGTYDRWADELRHAGYTVLAPIAKRKVRSA